MTHSSTNNLIDLAEEIKRRPILTEYLTPAKKSGFICPNEDCKNGSGEDGTGTILSKDATRLLCGKCGKGFSNIDVIAYHLGLKISGKDFVEIVKHGCQILAIDFNSLSYSPNDETHITKKSVEKIIKPFERLIEAREKLKDLGGSFRGLTLNTLQQLNWGFLPDIYFSDAKKKLPAVIIPNDEGGIFARSIEGRYYCNNKPTATTTIFLPAADSFDVIITEGAINGASILQAVLSVTNVVPVFAIIASGGTSGNKNVLERLQQLKNSGKIFRVLIAYDNDTGNAGQIAADKLFKSLLKANFKACIVDITKTPDIDPNDILCTDNGDFKLFDMVTSVTYDAQEKFNNAEKFTSANQQITSNENFISINDDEDLKEFKIPDGYKITKNGSIVKVSVSMDENGKEHIQQKSICPRTLFIKEKLFNLEEKTFKQILAYRTVDGKLKIIPAQDTSTIFNKNKLVELTNYSQLFTTSNAKNIVDWLFAFSIFNETTILLTYTINRCGWYEYNDQTYFVDPRRENQIEDDGKKFNLTVDAAKCQLANSLIGKGNIDEWRKAYLLAKPSTIARATVAASVAAPLLKILNERNFVFYVHGKTTGGKSTALFLGSSAIGRKDLVRIFDGSTTALNALAAETNHLPLFIDEKQSADQKLKQDFARWIYNDANGTEKQRANKDGTARVVREWLHITLANGETELLNDNTTGGAFTRLLQIAAPPVILDADTCKRIRDILKDNYGVAWTPYIDLICKTPIEEIQEMFNCHVKVFGDMYPNILPEYRRYIALICVADEFLNKAIGTFKNCDSLDFQQIFDAVPTKEEIDDTAREKNAVTSFVVTKAKYFDGNIARDSKAELFGRYSEKIGYLFIIKAVLDKYLNENGYDAKKVASDLVADGFFKPSNKIEKGYKNPRPAILVKFDGNPVWCYRIPLNLIDEKTVI